MSSSNPLNAIFGNQKFTELDDVDIPSLIPNSLIVVNPSGTDIVSLDSSNIVPPIVGTGTVNDICLFTGTVPVLKNSGLNVNTPFVGEIQLSTTNINDSLTVNANNITLNTPNTANLTADNAQLILFNNMSIGVNNNLTIQVGPNQILLSPTSVQINCGSGVGMTISNNNAGDVWNFSGSALGGSYTMPLTNGLNGSVLTNDGSGNLSWVGGA